MRLNIVREVYRCLVHLVPRITWFYACIAHFSTDRRNLYLHECSAWKGYGSRHRVSVASKLKQVALAGKEFLSSPCSDLAWAAAEGAREFKALIGLLPQILSGMFV